MVELGIIPNAASPMSVSFKQLRDDIAISEKEGFGIMVLSSLLIVGLGLLLLRYAALNPWITVLIMLALAWMGRPWARKYFGDFAKPSDVIGTLVFEEHSIHWTNGNSRVYLNRAEIAALTLHFNYIQGKQFASKDIIHNGLAQLQLQSQSELSYQVKFLVETEEQLEHLKPLWKGYYMQKIKIKERMGKYEIKTILFEKADLSFEKMQELKNELHVDWL